MSSSSDTDVLQVMDGKCPYCGASAKQILDAVLIQVKMKSHETYKRKKRILYKMHVENWFVYLCKMFTPIISRSRPPK